MGTIKQGILGGFSGKVGTVIGSSWKGISYMRGQAQSIKNPKTEGQTNQRTKFALSLAFLQSVMPVINIGFRNHAQRQSPFNAAMSYTLRNAVTGIAPDFALDFAKVLVSHGNLSNADGATASADAGTVSFAWNDNSGAGSAAATDIAMAVVFNADKGEAVTVTAGTERSTQALDVAIPSAWAGDTVHTYIAFVATDGASVSDSIYTGSLTAA